MCNTFDIAHINYLNICFMKPISYEDLFRFVHPCDSATIIARNVSKMRFYFCKGVDTNVVRRFTHLKFAKLYLLHEVKSLLPESLSSLFTNSLVVRLLTDKCLCKDREDALHEMGVYDIPEWGGDTTHTYYEISDCQVEEIANAICALSND